MTEMCPACGLPKDLCVCQEIAKEKQKIRIRVETKKYQKRMTVIENLDPDTDLEDICTQLKRKLACGGTVKNGRIELQGGRTDRVKEALIKLNFPEDRIETS
ncbi:MAG: translation initiation factor [Candidatus Diapherotrites archaeon]|nr:translation initiation factor [Candidatus Diapherotrites archaeon]